jgi:hypothetical protein
MKGLQVPDVEPTTDTTPAATPDDATTVEVTVTPPETSEPETPEVVVVETGDDSNPAVEAVLVEAAIDDAKTLAALSVAYGAMQEQIAALEQRVNMVEVDARIAVDLAVESVPDPEPEPVQEPVTVQEPAAEDSEPDRDHGFFRPLFGGKR